MKKPVFDIYVFYVYIKLYKGFFTTFGKNTTMFTECREIWTWLLYLLFGKLPEPETYENAENLNEIFEPNDSLRDDFSIVRIIEQDEKEE
jgi:hypothetical protein